MSDVDAEVVLPAPCLVVLIGACSGKSTWASAHFPPDQVVSSDALRALVAHCRDADRDPGEVAVTQLSTTLTAASADDVRALVRRLRPRSWSDERYAASVHAGTVDDQIGRFRALAEAGVGTAIVSLPDLDGTPDAIERFTPVVAACRSG